MNIHSVLPSILFCLNQVLYSCFPSRVFDDEHMNLDRYIWQDGTGTLGFALKSAVLVVGMVCDYGNQDTTTVLLQYVVCVCCLCLMTPIPYVVCCKASRWSRSRKSCWKPGAGSDWPYHASARPAIAIHGLHESQCTQLQRHQRHLDVRTLRKDKSCRFSIEPRITCRTPKPWRLRDFQL